MRRSTQRVCSLLVAWTLMALLLMACGSDSGDQRAKEPAEADSLTIVLIGTDSISVLELLLAEHEVDYEQTSAGAFVKGIDSVVNGSGHFWLYLVNGKPVPMASDKCLTSAGDTITWVFRGGY